MARTSASSRPLTDHDEIRRWAEERNARPACVRGTGSGEDVGMIRLDFPGYTGEDKLEEVSWDEWFDKFDERGLALLVQETTARGQQSNFNKLVRRDTASEGSRTRSRSTANSRNGSRSSRTTGRTTRGRARSSSPRASSTRGRSAQSGRGRNRSSSRSRAAVSSRTRTGSRSSRSSSSRSTSSRRSSSSRSSSRSAKKAPARARISSQSSRGRSSSRRRAA